MIFLPSCGKTSTDKYENRYIAAFDTIITVKIKKSEKSSKILNETEKIILKYEKAYSKTLENSLVYRFNNEETQITLDETGKKIIQNALEISRLTSGAYDVTVYPLVELWDIKSDTPKIPPKSDIDKVLEYVGYEKLVLNENVLMKTDERVKIDLGSIVKGAALDEIISYYKSENVEYALISLGQSSIGLFGKKEDGSDFNIGISDPREKGSVILNLRLKEGTVSVSGDNERFFIKDGRRYSHIIDPKTGEPAVTDIQSVVVICDNAMLGDAISTALFVMGYEKGIDFYRNSKIKFEAIFICEDGIKTTSDTLNITINKKGN